MERQRNATIQHSPGCKDTFKVDVLVSSFVCVNDGMINLTSSGNMMTIISEVIDRR